MGNQREAGNAKTRSSHRLTINTLIVANPKEPRLIELDRIAAGPLEGDEMLVIWSVGTWGVQFYKRCTQERYDAILAIIRENLHGRLV